MSPVTTLDFCELVVPDSVAIPDTLEGARILLDGVGGLMSAGHWGTASVVWAYTEDAQGLRTDLGEKSSKLSISAFAELKIRGLSTRDSVRKYRRAWEHAIEQGWAEPAVPGNRVRLPSEPFKAERKDRSTEVADIEQRVAIAFNHAIRVMRDEDLPDVSRLRQIDLIMAPLEPLAQKTQAIADHWQFELERADITIEECSELLHRAIQLERPMAFFNLLMAARVGEFLNTESNQVFHRTADSVPGVATGRRTQGVEDS